MRHSRARTAGGLAALLDAIAHALLLACLLGGVVACGDALDLPSADAAQGAEQRDSLVALARLEPSSSVVNVGVQASGILDEILVEEGDQVEESQVLFRLKSHRLRLAELEAAKLELERAKLQPLEVEAQRARLRAAEAEFRYARDEVGSQKGLSEKGFSAGRDFRDAELNVKLSKEKVSEATSVLKQMEANAELQVREAENGLVQSQARLEQSILRSPLRGRILRIRFRVGENVGGQPLASIGATENMHAVAEVHANEIRLVKQGQRARFSSPALESPIDGTVEYIGAMIFSNYITGEDPSAPRGLRVVKVRVELDHNEQAQRLTNLEGQLRIFLSSPASP